MKELSDNELAAAYRAGNKPAFDELVFRHLKSVYFFCVKLVGPEEAKDMAQETFIKVWKKIKKYDPKKSFKVWLFRIARNNCLDQLRKKQPLLFSSLRSEDEEILPEEMIADNRAGVEQKIWSDEEKMVIQKALGGLNPATQEVFTLYYREEMTFQEIAETLELSINTVKSRHRRGLMDLRRYFTDKNAPKSIQNP